MALRAGLKYPRQAWIGGDSQRVRRVDVVAEVTSEKVVCCESDYHWVENKRNLHLTQRAAAAQSLAGRIRNIGCRVKDLQKLSEALERDVNALAESAVADRQLSELLEKA